MASVKVAVRVRPFNQREKDMGAKLIVQMEGKKTRLLTVKNSKEQNDGTREKYKDFTFDHSYWSFAHEDSQYASQEQVFADLGLDVIDSAFEGYNACVFAYGQTGSGKTFTMMGSNEFQGLIPRICRHLFSRVAAGKESGASYRTEVSYLEIYNERVKDLLATDAGHSLRVREHPKLGPYVQDLSKHLVSDYDDIQECMHRGNLHRTTASTQMNDVSSRSHAIFTITFVQASYLRHNNMPSETVSKVHLVDLAGSERADATGATGQRLVEGAHINKSLVTLGSVISALADSSQPLEVRAQKGAKKVFIPYRDSVLTWLLKDSLGGNSKTIMIAAISPADCNYGETLSTLRYANRAKNIINKPTINEDPNVKLIRELREEIEKLRAQIAHDTDPIDTEPGVLATLQRKEAQEKVLTEKWTEKWRETQQILQEQKALGLRKSGLGVVLDSDMPHLVGIDDDLLSTGVTLYHLKEGETVIGSAEYRPLPDIVLSGAAVLPLHCRVSLAGGTATLLPAPGAQCWLNTVLLDGPAKLSQGCILLLGRTNMFRYNDPAEAAKLRQEGSASVMNLSRLSLLSWSTTDLAASTENLNTTLSDLESEIRCERIEAQRAELERERQQFLLQQEERQRRWHAEREELLQAQRKLDEERQAMEREYAAACRRLSGDWRALERGWTQRRRALRCRQRELAQRTLRLSALSDTHRNTAESEEGRVAELRARVADKRAALDEYVSSTARELRDKYQSSTPSPDSPASETSTESLMHLLQQCEPKVASSIKDTVERHKKELVELEEELQTRVASVASHRVKIERLQAELALLSTQELGLKHALASDLGPGANREGAAEAVSPQAVQRSKSELVLRRTPREALLHPRAADTDTDADHYQHGRINLSLSLDPLASPHSTEEFHTASSSPKRAEWPPVEAAPAEREPVSAAAPAPVFRLGARHVPRADDSDDMSSTEDYHKPRIVEGQSSSSVERSPEERQQKSKYKRRLPGERAGGRRQVTEVEALRAMQRLCSRIASQKMLVISSLENDCSKEELNRQIAVLQELQKKYVRLEMALQYSFFDNQSRRPMMVTPIQETPSLTLSESDMHVATDNDDHENGLVDPLLHRLKEQELEGSDNVSTSNDELPSEPHEPHEPPWEDPLRRLARADRTDRPDRPDRPDRLDLIDRIECNTLESSLPDPTICAGLLHPIDFSQVVSIPGWVTRGAGAGTHHEYEVRIALGGCRWLLLRRYRRFRELQQALRRGYGAGVAGGAFPARTLWPGEATARARRPQLEAWLRRVLAAAAQHPRCPFREPRPLTRDALVGFSPFFRKGVFESGKCGTG
ncbi:kinesin-like protein Klp98A [Trichoplusia ni]|uniref:Kinesin-like protein Klp98A n=1 Tax=Trichoplusia ni TaxID=7111 RepID=A0A7E5WQL2_TRINI|nr:kinesin-like protein Klp98A [Trichoplusia ni]